MITEKAAAAIPGTRRRRLGDGMLEPVKVLEFRDPYSRGIQQLRPGRDYVSTDWWGYRKHPELFMPASRDDTQTVDRHREGARKPGAVGQDAHAGS